MSYDVRYKFRIVGIEDNETTLKYANELTVMSDYEGMDLFDDTDTIEYWGNAQWWDTKDMIPFSKKYPELLFVIDAFSVDELDVWREYWQDGKCQHIDAEILMDAHDPNKMKKL